MQTSSNWGCYSPLNTVIIKDPEIVTPLTNNIDASYGQNNGMIKIINSSIIVCGDTINHTIMTCWQNSTLAQDDENGIPSFDEQIDYGANCVVDSLYGLLAQDSSWLAVDFISLITLDIGYVGSQVHCKDTLLFQLGNNTTVEEIDFNKILKIYPNPAKEQLTIIGLDKLNINKIEIFDISGKVLKTIDVYQTSEELKINISDLNEGIYFIKLENYVGKFVKQ